MIAFLINEIKDLMQSRLHTRSYWMKNQIELFHIHHSKYKLENIVANISKKTKIFQCKIKCVLWHPTWLPIHRLNKLQNKHKWSTKQFAIYLNEKNTTLIVHKKMNVQKTLFVVLQKYNKHTELQYMILCMFIQPIKQLFDQL